MKVYCPQHLFNQHLGLVSRAVSSRPQAQPILGHVLVEAGLGDEGGYLQLTGYDLDMGVVSRFGAMVTEPGTVTLPSRLLGDIVSRLPNMDICLAGQLEGDELTSVTLQCGAAAYQIRGMAASDYPELPELPAEQSLLLPSDRFLAGIKMTLFAAATDEGKQILTGVHLKTTKDGLEFATTDGHRLALASSEGVMDAGLDLTIPGRTLRELERMLAGSPAETFEARFDRSQIVFLMPEQTLTSRLLDGAYPNYNQLLPKSFSKQALINRKEFITALERIAVLASQKNNIVRLELTSDLLALSVDAPDVGSGREELGIQLTGGDLTIAFNVKYLLDALKAIESLEVQFNFNGAVNPAVLKPLDGMDFQYLIMPVQIRG